MVREAIGRLRDQPASARAAVVILAVSVVMFIAAALQGDGPGSWDPLGDYPVQEVLEVTDTHVIVEGTKCNDSNAPVDVEGFVQWRRLDPLGFVHQSFPPESGVSRGTRIVGCETRIFENAIPAEVIAADSPGDRVPIPRPWHTEAFVLTE